MSNQQPHILEVTRIRDMSYQHTPYIHMAQHTTAPSAALALPGQAVPVPALPAAAPLPAGRQ